MFKRRRRLSNVEEFPMQTKLCQNLLKNLTMELIEKMLMEMVNLNS
jgi:hypothetical protein